MGKYDQAKVDMQVRARAVAEQLEGTVRDLSEFATEEERGNRDFCNELDTHIFLCEECGWWCSVDEESEQKEQTCTDCEM